MKEHKESNEVVDLSTRKGGFLFAPHVEGRPPVISYENEDFYTPGHVAGCRCGSCWDLRMKGA